MARIYLFLQGPHGPFFDRLAARLRRDGALTLKVGFSRADDAEWSGAPYLAYTGGAADWPGWLTRLARQRGVTDIVLYGDTRPRHQAALAVARTLGLVAHVFEEGYLRPYWVTYERGGANGHSPLVNIPLDRIRAAAALVTDYEPTEAPAHWGAAWRHALHGFIHHFRLAPPRGGYPPHAPHRPTGVGRELWFYLKRLLVLPLLVPLSRARAWALRRSGAACHVVLLQLSADVAHRAHGPFDSVGDFVDHSLEAFARGARPGDLIVFKSHPFEDGRERLERRMRRTARRLGLSGRARFLHGGKLGPLLDRARSAVTVNSTAGQQALWRGLPLAALGQSVYARPEFVGCDDLAGFFAAPRPPDAAAYRAYRQFLMMTSQLRGGFYTGAGIRAAVEAAAVKMRDPLDPYARALIRVEDEAAITVLRPRSNADAAGPGSRQASVSGAQARQEMDAGRMRDLS